MREAVHVQHARGRRRALFHHLAQLEEAREEQQHQHGERDQRRTRPQPAPGARSGQRHQCGDGERKERHLRPGLHGGRERQRRADGVAGAPRVEVQRRQCGAPQSQRHGRHEELFAGGEAKVLGEDAEQERGADRARPTAGHRQMQQRDRGNRQCGDDGVGGEDDPRIAVPAEQRRRQLIDRRPGVAVDRAGLAFEVRVERFRDVVVLVQERVRRQIHAQRQAAQRHKEECRDSERRRSSRPGLANQNERCPRYEQQQSRGENGVVGVDRRPRVALQDRAARRCRVREHLLVRGQCGRAVKRQIRRDVERPGAGAPRRRALRRVGPEQQCVLGAGGAAQTDVDVKALGVEANETTAVVTLGRAQSVVDAARQVRRDRGATERRWGATACTIVAAGRRHRQREQDGGQEPVRARHRT